MQIYMLTLALCAGLAAADVSHLSNSYLPPARQAQPEQVVSTSIEQQELRELPEQVEYMQAQPMAVDMEQQSPSGMLTPPADMPAARYLPPAPMQQIKMAEQPAMQYMPMPMPMPMPIEQPQQQPATRYLPPQPSYQQYQEQLMQPEQQMPQQEPAMQYMMDVQQPLAPSDMETMSYEPEPAHELRADGYHYKAAEAAQSLRH